MYKRQTEPIRSRRRTILFRLLAITIGFSPLLICEAALRIGGWQQTNAVHDPFVGFTEIRPLFEPNPQGTHYEISKSRLPLFQPDSFLIEKPDDEFRIFCVGGSTVQGRPFSIETSFSTWLEMNLNTTDGSKNWQAINCGGVSYASYRLAPIVDEILKYEPDLIVLYTGHNEFLEDRTYESIRQTPAWIARSHDRLSALKTYSFLRSQFVANPADQNETENTLPAEVEARLDFKNGLEQYHRDDLWKQEVTQHFNLNLRRIISAVRAADVPIILCNPACDLRDSAPFKSQHRIDISAADREKFSNVRLKFQNTDTAEQTAEFEKQTLQRLLEIDAEHAMSHFKYATFCLAQGEGELAKHHFLKSKELDICPLRATEPIYETIAAVIQEFELPSIDVRNEFSLRAPDGIAGRESLIDHVHPTIHGHQLIAEMLLEEMIELKLLSATVDVDKSEIEQRYAEHLKALPFMYFQQGKDRLAGLKRWAAGKVTKERPTDKAPKTTTPTDNPPTEQP